MCTRQCTLALQTDNAQYVRAIPPGLLHKKGHNNDRGWSSLHVVHGGWCAADSQCGHAAAVMLAMSCITLARRASLTIPSIA